MLTEHRAVATKLLRFMSNHLWSETAHIRRKGVVAAMFATWSKSAQASQDFWTGVVTGEMLTRNDPKMRLRTFLQDSVVQGSLGTNSAKRVVDAEGMYRASIIAWNAHRDSKEVKQTLRPGMTQRRPVVK
jgi:hypothetical protein